jgi:hypothetical protein
MVTRTRKRILNTLVLAALFVGFAFGLALSATDQASASYSKPIYSSADCAFLEANFWYYSEKAGEAYNDGNYEDATFYTQLASQAIDSARRGGCSWPGEVFPTT